MALSASKTYIRRGNVACPLSIPSPGSYSGEHTLTIDLSSHAYKGRLSSESPLAVFYPETGDMVIRGTADEINTALSTLIYHGALDASSDIEAMMPTLNAAVILKDGTAAVVATGVLVLTPSIKARYIRTNAISWTSEPTEEQTNIEWSGQTEFQVPSFVKGSVTQYVQTIKAEVASPSTFKILDADLNRRAGRWNAGTKTWKVNADYEALENFNKGVRVDADLVDGAEVKLDITITDGYDGTVEHTAYLYNGTGVVTIADTTQSVNDTSIVFAAQPFVVSGPTLGDTVTYTAKVTLGGDSSSISVLPKAGLWTASGESNYHVDTTSVPSTSREDNGDDRSVSGGGLRYSVGDLQTLSGGTTIGGDAATFEVASITGPYCFGIYDWTPQIGYGGIGYEVGDILTLAGGTPIDATRLIVTSVNEVGSISGVTDSFLGQYAEIADLPTGTQNLTGGTGSGATIYIPVGRAAGSAASYTLLNPGKYSVQPVGQTGNNNDNLVLIPAEGAGFWAQINIEWEYSEGSTYVVSGTRETINEELSDIQLSRSNSDTPTFTVTANVTNTLGMDETSDALSITIVNVAGATQIVNGGRVYTWTEDAAFNFSPEISVIDNDGQTITFTATLSAAAGVLSSSAGGTWNSGQRKWTFTGTETNVNAALADLVFTPTANYSNNFTIALTANDTTATTNGLVTMNCIPNIDENSITGIPVSKTYDLNSSSNLFFSDVAITEPDADEIFTVQISLDDANAGTWNGGGGVGAASVYTLTGKVASINAALPQVKFAPKVSAALSASNINASLVWTEDTNKSFSDKITVTGRSIYTGSTNVNVLVESNTANLENSFSISSLTGADATTLTATFTLPAAAGTLVFSTTPTATIVGSNRVYTFTGTASVITNLINNGSDKIMFVPAANYDESFAVSVQVVHGSSVVNGSIGMSCTAVAEAPTITTNPTVSPFVYYLENLSEGNKPLNGIVVTENDDPPSSVITCRLWLENLPGTLSGITFSSGDGSSSSNKAVFTGTAAEITTKLQLLKYDIVFDGTKATGFNAEIDPFYLEKTIGSSSVLVDGFEVSGSFEGKVKMELVNAAGTVSYEISGKPASMSFHFDSDGSGYYAWDGTAKTNIDTTVNGANYRVTATDGLLTTLNGALQHVKFNRSVAGAGLKVSGVRFLDATASLAKDIT